MDRFDDAARRATYETCLRVLGRSPGPDDYVPVIAKALRDAHKLGADEAQDGGESGAGYLRAELAAARAEVERYAAACGTRPSCLHLNWIAAMDRATEQRARAEKAEAENAAWRADYLHIAEALGRVHDADYIYVPADLPTLLKRIAELDKAEARVAELDEQLHRPYNRLGMKATIDDLRNERDAERDLRELAEEDRDEARAEATTLRAENERITQVVQKSYVENERLRDMQRSFDSDWAALRAENATLRAERVQLERDAVVVREGHWDELVNERDALRAEVERLRAFVLRAMWTISDHSDGLTQLVRAALKIHSETDPKPAPFGHISRADETQLNDDAEVCGKRCDHGSECLKLAGHDGGHETQHGCVFYDEEPQ